MMEDRKGIIRRLAMQLRRQHYQSAGIEGMIDATTSPSHNALTMWHSGAPAAHADEEKAEHMREQLLRLQAEFENYRKRQQRDEQIRIDQANQKLLEQVLPVIDNFERALSNPGSSVDALASGIEMVRKQLVDILVSAGLERIDALGQPFDPNVHEAVCAEPSDEHPDNHVTAVFQEGYRLKGRLLRPAMVKVARG